MNKTKPNLSFIENPSFDNIPQCLSYIVQKLHEFEQNFKSLSPNSIEEEFLDMKSAADFLHLSVSRLYTLCQTRKIPFIKNGKRNLFSKAVLIEFLNSNSKPTIEQIEKKVISEIATTKIKNYGKQR